MRRGTLVFLLAVGLLLAGCVGDGLGGRGRPRDAAYSPRPGGSPEGGPKETLFVEPPPVSPNRYPHLP